MTKAAHLSQLHFPLETVLLDGTPVRIRPVEPGDKRLFEVAFQQLSEEDRYNRFFRPISELTETMLQELTEIDHVSEEAIAALDLSMNPVAPVGIARYVQTSEDPSVAEIATTIVSTHHGRGLGTLLMALLSKRALENDIQCFSAVVLDHNIKMRKLFDDLAPLSKKPGRGTIDYLIPLHDNPGDYPKTPTGQVFRDVSANAMFRQAS